MYFKTKTQADEYFKSAKVTPILGGSEGMCYNLHDGNVAKVLYNPVPIKENHLLDFKDVYTQSFIFNKDLITMPFWVYGTIMPFAPGDKCINRYLYNYPISILSPALERVYQDVITISASKIAVGGDVSVLNILFDGTNFYFIDTADYIRSKDAEDFILCGNLKEVMSLLYGCILSGANVYHFLQDLYKLSYFKEADFFYQSPQEFIEYIQRKMEEYLSAPITSFADADSMLARKRLPWWFIN